ALGGSPVADYLLGLGHPVDDHMPKKYREGLDLMKPFGAYVKKVDREGLLSLEEKTSKTRWLPLFKAYPQAEAILGPRIFYVQGQQNISHLPALLRPVGSYVATYYGPSDGLLLSGDQIIEGIGRPILKVKTDHLGLFLGKPQSGTPKSLRTEFTQFLYRF